MRRGLMVCVVVLGLMGGVPRASALPSTHTPTDSEQAKTAFDDGYRHQKAGRFQDAIDAYERSLRYDRTQAEALSNMGFCYKSLKRYQKAIGSYKDALAIDPKLDEAHEYLGEAYVELGKLELAEREYRTLVELGSDEAEELREKIDEAREASVLSDAQQHDPPR